MKWDWFGWFAFVSLCLFPGFLLFPAVTNFIPYKLASISMLVAMVSSVVCPAIASIRSSNWWLILSFYGLSSILWFLRHLTA
jgi:hypothetical protein